MSDIKTDFPESGCADFGGTVNDVLIFFSIWVKYISYCIGHYIDNFVYIDLYLCCVRILFSPSQLLIILLLFIVISILYGCTIKNEKKTQTLLCTCTYTLKHNTPAHTHTIR